MRNSFDPYSEWLGIDSQGLHPDRYQLLGLQRFETDLGAISAGAKRQVAAMRPHENGPQAALAKKVLEELETARACLSDPGKKQTYDSLLRQQMAARAAQAPVAPPPPPAPRVSAAPAAPPVAAMPPAAEDAHSATDLDALLPPMAMPAAAPAAPYGGGNFPAAAAPTDFPAAVPPSAYVAAAAPYGSVPPAAGAPAYGSIPVAAPAYPQAAGGIPQAVPVASPAIFAQPGMPGIPQSAIPQALPAVPQALPAHPGYYPQPIGAAVPMAMPANPSYADYNPPAYAAPAAAPAAYAAPTEFASHPDYTAVPAAVAVADAPVEPEPLMAGRADRQRNSNAKWLLLATVGPALAIVCIGVVIYAVNHGGDEGKGDRRRVAANSRKQPADDEKPVPADGDEAEDAAGDDAETNQEGTADSEKTSTAGDDGDAMAESQADSPPATAMKPEPEEKPEPEPETKPETKPEPMPAADAAQAMAAARAEMAAGRPELAQQQLESVGELAADDPHAKEFERVKAMVHYVQGFWTAVGESIAMLEPGQDFAYEDSRAVLVQKEGKNLEFRIAGQSRTFPVDDLPPKIAYALAENRLDANDPNNKLFLGAFQLVSTGGDREKARALWLQASLQGFQEAVDVVMPEIDAAPPEQMAAAPSAAPAVDAPPPLPDEAALKAAREEVKTVYSDDFGKAQEPADKQLLVEKLLTDGLAVEGAPAKKYALFVEARALAEQLGNIELLMRVLDAVGESFAVDVWKLKGEALASLGKTAAEGAPETNASLAHAALDLADEAVVLEKFDAAMSFMRVAVAAARKAKDGELLKDALARNKEVVEARKSQKGS